jgi:hypothetical protein
MARNSAAYHDMYRTAGRKRNHGHAHDHRYGRLYWSWRVDKVEIKCDPPKGKHARRGF